MKNQPVAADDPPANSGFDATVASIFDGVFDFYGTLDSTGEVVSLFGSIYERTNIDPKKLKGQKFADTVFWQSYEATAQTLRAAIADAIAGNAAKLLLDFRVNADEKVAVDLILQPMPADGSGSVVFIGGRAAAHPAFPLDERNTESEQLLVAADIAGIGLWYWDFNESRIYTTPKCNDLLSITPHSELTYESLLASIHPDDQAAVKDFLEHARAKGMKFEEEFRVVYTDGSVETISCEGKSYAENDRPANRMLGVVRRITEEKQAAFELAQVYEREMRARDEAVDANRAKDFFLAFVSHELRSPLNAILGWSKILLTKQVDDETRTNALQTIEKSARFQTKLIDDLVDSARVASGKLRLEYRPVNLYEIVNASFQAQMPTASTHNIEFTLTADSDQVPVFGDAGRLQQIFANLLSNAVKFTPDGGSVAIDLKTTHDNAIVSVTDSGQGIGDDALPGIFRQFSQGDISQARRNSGLGLGLSIVNILVEKHGGTVRAESPGLGLGATFTVTIPLSMSRGGIEEVIRTPAAALNPQPLAGIKILIVEDDNDSREVLHLFLQQSGATVESSDSAKSAIKMLDVFGGLPDIIVSDLAMPDEDGYTLLAKIRKLPAESGGKVPAIALSAFATAESRNRALESGFTSYATKPFEPDLLIREIVEIVGRSAKRPN
ncbi:MAG: ATP-binding protein [Acidobacteriota bacterium]